MNFRRQWISACLLYTSNRQSGGANAKAMNFGKSRARMSSENDKKVTFADVAGLQEEKEELAEIVDFLKSPKKYVQVGARIPKGVLLEEMCIRDRISMILVLLVGVLAVNAVSLRSRNAQYKKQEAELEAQIKEEKKRAKEVEAYEAYVKTDDYVKEIAEEKLGLVDPNEIIFKPAK